MLLRRTWIMVLSVTCLLLGALIANPLPAQAATPTFAKLVVYVRAGDIYVSKGPTEQRLTTGGGHFRPRWSPDGTRIAYIRNGFLWVMNADGTGQRQVTSYPAHGPAWADNGRTIVFANGWCLYRVYPDTSPTPFPVGDSCAGTVPSDPAWIPSGDLTQRLRGDKAAAVSNSGTFVAAPVGDSECGGPYDNWLAYFVLNTGAEVECVAYFGGGGEPPGFAVAPQWRPDDRRLAWTAYSEEYEDPEVPIHIVEYDTVTHTTRTIGQPLDRELSYISSSKALITGQYRNGSWVILVDLATGARRPFRQGSQPDYQG
jgi:TolB protein